MLIRPERNKSYTLEEMLSLLYLRDNPSLGFTHNEIDGCIQDSHVTLDELLSVPGMKESKWVYIRETYEWIPVFRFDINVNQPPITTLADLEIYVDKYSLNKEKTWWATPKGFPRDQSE